MRGPVTYGALKPAWTCLVRALVVLFLILPGPFHGCRQIVDYVDPLPPDADQRIVWERAGGLQGEAILALRIDNVGTILAGTESGKLYRSVTGGNDWTPIPLPVQDGAVSSILVDPTRRMYVANDIHGVFQSNDGGQTWSHSISGMEDTSIYSLAYLPSGKLIAGSARGYVYFPGSGALSWEARFSLARPVTALLVLSSEDVFAATWSSGVYRFGEFSPAVIQVNTGLPDLYLNSLHVSGGGFLFAATRNSGVYRSEATDIFWQSVGGGSIGREIHVFRTSQYGELFAGTATGVYISYDRGVRWYKLDAGIGSREVRALAIDDAATVYAGTADGVYRSIRLD